MAIPASAQLTCTAFVANQPTLRQEGITEPAGDIIITCTQTATVITGTALAGPQTLSLYVQGAAITSRQLYTGSTAPTSIPTEAAILIDDCTAVGATSPVTGLTTTCANTASTDIGTPTQGNLQNGALVFTGFGLPLTLGSSTTVLATANTFQLRITNVRVNANSVASGTFINGTVLATFPIQNQTNLVLGVAQSSLNVTVSSPPSNFTQCTSQTAGSTITDMTIKELVLTAFKAPNACGTINGSAAQGSNPGACPSGATNTAPGGWYQNGTNTESQTVLPGLPTSGVPYVWSNALGNTPGLADSATRVRVNLSNIPAGVTVTMPVTICNAPTSAGACTGTQNTVAQATTGGDTGTFSIAASGPTLTSSGSVTYQLVSVPTQTISTAATLAQLVVPITVTYTYTPPSTPAVGTVLVSATYAPTSAEISNANPAFGIPRFADTSVLQPVFTIAACQTDLLFTFLTNQAGYDTGFEIANTSSDPFGTAAQNGTCTLNWYGSGPAAGTATTTPSIASGTAYTNLVSVAAAGFQGYMIAVCNFQYGHGFAFLIDGYGQPGRGLSQGYLASVIPTPGLQPADPTAATRNASDVSLTHAAGAGESLNQ